MGFQVKEVTSVADGRRLVLESIDKGSPAEKSGLRPEDVLLRIGAYEVRAIDDLRNAMFYSRVGQFVEVEVGRETETRIITVKLDQRPANEPLQVVRSVPVASMPMVPVRDSDETDQAEGSPLMPAASVLPKEEPRRNVPVQGGPKD